MLWSLIRTGAMLALAAAALGSAAAQEFTFRISSPTINDSTQEYAKTLKAGVEERSKGRIKVEFYPANQLGQIPATVDGVALGTIQMTLPAIGFFIGIEPRFQTLEATGLFDSMAHGNKVLADPEIRKRLSTFGEAQGVEPLFTILHGELFLVTSNPVNTVADLKGLKLRVAGAAPMHTEPFKRLGASPVAMPLGEVLPALQNRAIDGALMSIPVVMGFKYYDVTKTITRMPAGYLLISGLVNRRFMKSLGPELEAIVREESLKAEEKFNDWAFAAHDRLLAAWEKVGGRTANFSGEDRKAFQAAVDGSLAAVIANKPALKQDYEAFAAAAKKYR
jgi:TRAP-type transport system periplasmic protein